MLKALRSHGLPFCNPPTNLFYNKMIMVQNNLIDYYNKNAENFIQDTINVNMDALYQPFLSLIQPGGNILDAGCGSGRDTLYFKNMGYQVTAFDASEELVKISSALIGHPVLHLSFDDIIFRESFDGIWACASLLHLPKAEMASVIKKLHRVLKPNGVLYTSFKYGLGEGFRNGRYFSDYTDESFRDLISEIPELQIISTWITTDVRKGRSDEKWLNILLNIAN